MKYMRATFNGNARPNSREWRSDRGVFTLMNGVHPFIQSDLLPMYSRPQPILPTRPMFRKQPPQ
jgi:hypothetical protein